MTVVGSGTRALNARQQHEGREAELSHHEDAVASDKSSVSLESLHRRRWLKVAIAAVLHSPSSSSEADSALFPAAAEPHRQESSRMGFTTFAGRVLFCSLFIFGGWLRYTDEDTQLQILEPKMDLLRSYMVSHGIPLPEFQLKYVLTMSVAVQEISAILLILGNSLGAYFLLMLTVVGTPMLHDFYNYDVSSPEYAKQFQNFIEHVALVGALLFYLGMKNEIAVKSRKREVKVKAV